MHGAKACHSFSLIGPEGEELASDVQIFSLLGLLSQILTQSFQFALLQAKHSVATAPLSVNSLSLFNTEALLGLQKLLHSLGAEADEELI